MMTLNAAWRVSIMGLSKKECLQFAINMVPGKEGRDIEYRFGFMF